jgi:hypothetical protein
MCEMLCVMIHFLSIYLIILKINLLNWFNLVSNNPINEQDQHEAGSYLDMYGDGIEAKEVIRSEQPVAETRNDGQPS